MTSEGGSSEGHVPSHRRWQVTCRGDGDRVREGEDKGNFPFACSSFSHFDPEHTSWGSKHQSNQSRDKSDGNAVREEEAEKGRSGRRDLGYHTELLTLTDLLHSGPQERVAEAGDK